MAGLLFLADEIMWLGRPRPHEITRSGAGRKSARLKRRPDNMRAGAWDSILHP
jgi:hypothetical protein